MQKEVMTVALIVLVISMFFATQPQQAEAADAERLELVSITPSVTGNTIQFTTLFNQDITVTPNEDTTENPAVTFNVGETAYTASFQQTSSSTLVTMYTIPEEYPETLTGNLTTVLFQLNGATIGVVSSSLPQQENQGGSLDPANQQPAETMPPTQFYYNNQAVSDAVTVTLASSLQFFIIDEDTQQLSARGQSSVITYPSDYQGTTPPAFLLFSPSLGVSSQERLNAIFFISDSYTACSIARTTANVFPSSDFEETTTPPSIIRLSNGATYAQHTISIRLHQDTHYVHARCTNNQNNLETASFLFSKLSGSSSFTLDIEPLIITESTNTMFRTNLVVDASQKLFCELKVNDGMFFSFLDNDGSSTRDYRNADYSKNYQRVFPADFNNPLLLEDKTSYLLTVRCKNLAGNTVSKTETISVNTAEPLKFIEILPEDDGIAFVCNKGPLCFTDEDTDYGSFELSDDDGYVVSLNVTVNKNAICAAELDDDTLLDLTVDENRFQHKRTHTFSTGRHPVEFTCTDSDTDGGQIMKTSAFFVDATPPTDFVVDDATSFLGLSEDQTHRTDRLSLTFSAEDEQSTIDYYAFRVLECGDEDGKDRDCNDNEVYPRQDNSDENILKLDDDYFRKVDEDYDDDEFKLPSSVRLDNKRWYVVEAFAVNEAGLANVPEQSNGVFVNTSLTPFSCSNRIKDGSETDVDCGGDCDGCDSGDSCNAGADCASDVCSSESICESSSCSDRIKNGDETDVDCGGDCPDCAVGESCSINSDCDSARCQDDVCVQGAAACSNNKKDAGETDVDCGGGCASDANFLCAAGQSCLGNNDCATGLVCLTGACASAPGTGNTDAPQVAGETDSSPAEGGFPWQVVVPVLFLLLLVGGVFVIKKYRQARTLYPLGSSPGSSASAPPPLSRKPGNRYPAAPAQRPLAGPPPARRRSIPAAAPTPRVAEKIREIPYLSGEKLFSQLKGEVVKEARNKRRKRKL